ncbi:MAG: hypothetical protein NZ480_06710 [Bdellovibrionaceae bacterium]|nr:hypothetical protein [Pseudobdellovibrionaceae bacterium]MDW8190602.1 hypothetical protein [Pseudobdellovibrionaceae bacterium]
MDSRSHIEVTIHDLWKTYRHEQLIVDVLLEKLFTQVIQPTDLHHLWRFFCLIGKPMAFHQIVFNLLEKNQAIHWGAWVEALNQCGFRFDEETANEILVLATTQNQLESLAQTFALDLIVPQVSKIRKRMITDKEAAFNKKKNELITQIEIDLSQDLLDKADEGLKILEKLDPHDDYVKKKRHELILKKANQILDKRTSQPKSIKVIKEEKPQSTSLPSEWKEIMRQSPTKIYDYAILAYELGDKDFCCKLLEGKMAEHYLLKENELWLLFQCYLDTYKLLNASKLLDYFKKHLFKPSVADHYSIYSYEKARLLYLLGDKKKAIKLLDELVQKNPDFRDADLLLKEWLKPQKV